MIKRFKNTFFARFLYIFILFMIIIFSTIIITWKYAGNNLAYNLSVTYLKALVINSNNYFENNFHTLLNISELISKSDNILKFYDEDVSLQENENISAVLNDYFMLNRDNINGIALLSVDGRYVGTSGIYVSSTTVNDAWFQSIINSEKQSAHIVSRNKIDDTAPNLTIAQPVIQNNKIIGAVLIDVKSSVIIKAYGISSSSHLMYNIIIDDSGNIIFLNDRLIDEEILQKLSSYAITKNVSSQIKELNNNNDPYIYMGYFSSVTNWTHFSLIKQSNITNVYNSSLNLSVLIIFIASISAFLLAFLLAIGMLKRLNNLLKQISKINIQNLSSANFDKTANKNDEIGIISQKLNNLVSTLEHQYADNLQLEKEKLEYEQEILKSQINPHFLYNTLNVITYLSNKKGVVEINTIATSLIDNLHYSINGLNETVTIEDELNYVKNYMEIVQFRFENRINTLFDYDCALLKCKTCKMLIQPIVENCVKHGLCGKKDEYIYIKVIKQGNAVKIKITDNGKGIPFQKQHEILDTSKQSNKIGLLNLQKRIKLLYGNDFGLEIISTVDVQTTVIITIPYIE